VNGAEIAIEALRREGVPVLALIGQVPDQIYHREAFEEMDLVRFFEPITKWSVEIHETSRIPELLQRAVRTALSGRPGPVMVSLPLDVQTAEAAATFQPVVAAVGDGPALVEAVLRHRPDVSVVDVRMPPTA
jgi:acetolactate synthase I/II/III large subunit